MTMNISSYKFMTKKASKSVFVVGVGMTKFEKPGTNRKDYPQLVQEAVDGALKDCNLRYGDMDQACVGYVYGDSTCGQRALYELGMTGIPILNVNNNCATGSSALYVGANMIRGGVANLVLVLGFEKMDKGSLTSRFRDRANPLENHLRVLSDSYGIQSAPMTAQLFGSAGKEHMAKYGTTVEHFAKIAWKNHKHSENNPNSQMQNAYTLEQIMTSRMISEPLTQLQCCPTSNGAAAAILASEKTVRKLGLEKQAVEIRGIEMSTDLPNAFVKNSCINMIGFEMSRLAAQKLYQNTGLGPNNVDVVELHDCFSVNELLTYEALGLCPLGKGGEMVDKGDNTYGGKYVVNPSGGLISKGHPLGATGVAQCAELCWQLRNMAGKRQVPNAKVALQHNIGLGGAVVVALYSMGDFQKQVASKL